MEEIEMLERYKIIRDYEGEDFKKKLDEVLQELNEQERLDFLMLARKRNIEDSKTLLEQSKVLRETRESLSDTEKE